MFASTCVGVTPIQVLFLWKRCCGESERCPVSGSGRRVLLGWVWRWHPVFQSRMRGEVRSEWHLYNTPRTTGWQVLQPLWGVSWVWKMHRRLQVSITSCRDIGTSNYWVHPWKYSNKGEYIRPFSSGPLGGHEWKHGTWGSQNLSQSMGEVHYWSPVLYSPSLGHFQGGTQ